MVSAKGSKETFLQLLIFLISKNYLGNFISNSMSEFDECKTNNVYKVGNGNDFIFANTSLTNVTSLEKKL